jgi:hypothetical protein
LIDLLKIKAGLKLALQKTLLMKAFLINPARLLLLLLSLTLFSCSKDSNPGYPKTVNIEYKVTALSGITGPLSLLSFTNETGGNTDLSNQSLPFTKTISKSVAVGDVVVLSLRYNNTTSSTPVSIKMEIIVDGKVVKTETSNSTTPAIIAAIAYAFS